MYALDYATYIITKCTNDGLSISNLKLQKILYYIQKEYLKLQGTPAFPDDIEAWKFGPVIPNVYYSFCGFGAMPITRTYSIPADFSSSDQEIIDPIVESKRCLPPWDLVSQTHSPGGAWDQTFKNGAGNRRIIPIDVIQQER